VEGDDMIILLFIAAAVPAEVWHGISHIGVGGWIFIFVFSFILLAAYVFIKGYSNEDL
jgi:hypothetical protein